MPKTKRYREARQLQEQEGGKYTDALQRADEDHARQKAQRQETAARTPVGRPQWDDIRSLTDHLRAILARLGTTEVFVPAENPFARASEPPKTVRLVVDGKWQMDLISTVTLLAERLRLPPHQFNSEHLTFAWVTPVNIEENLFLRFARQVFAVAGDLLKAVDR